MLSEKTQINFNYLKFFVEAAESYTLQEVADKTGYELSNVSMSLTNFEKQLGVKLFNRNPLKLTPIGKDIYESVVKGYRDIEFAGILAKKKTDIDNGNISIGCPLHIINFFLLDKINKAMKEHENLEFELDYESSNARMLKKIKSNNIQFALLDFIPFDIDMKVFNVEHIFNSDYIFVSNSKIEINDVSELNNYKYIMSYPHRSANSDLNKCLEKHGITLKTSIKCTSIDARIKAAKLGLGIAYVMRDAVKDELENGTLYEVKVPVELPRATINLIYMKDHLTKVDKQFIKEYLK